MNSRCSGGYRIGRLILRTRTSIAPPQGNRCAAGAIARQGVYQTTQIGCLLRHPAGRVSPRRSVDHTTGCRVDRTTEAASHILSIAYVARHPATGRARAAQMCHVPPDIFTVSIGPPARILWITRHTMRLSGHRTRLSPPRRASFAPPAARRSNHPMAPCALSSGLLPARKRARG